MFIFFTSETGTQCWSVTPTQQAFIMVLEKLSKGDPDICSASTGVQQTESVVCNFLKRTGTCLTVQEPVDMGRVRSQLPSM